MDIVIFAVCLIFELVFVLLGLKAWFFAMVGAVFGAVLSADLYANGLSEVFGYSGSSPLTRSFGVDTVILIPMLFTVVCGLALFVRFRSG